MHGATVKVINAQQARLNNTYKNTRLKLLKTNAAMWFKKYAKKNNSNPVIIVHKLVYKSD
jgi:hypothetical protein